MTNEEDYSNWSRHGRIRNHEARHSMIESCPAQHRGMILANLLTAFSQIFFNITQIFHQAYTE